MKKTLTALAVALGIFNSRPVNASNTKETKIALVWEAVEPVDKFTIEHNRAKIPGGYLVAKRTVNTVAVDTIGLFLDGGFVCVTSTDPGTDVFFRCGGDNKYWFVQRSAHTQGSLTLKWVETVQEKTESSDKPKVKT